MPTLADYTNPLSLLWLAILVGFITYLSIKISDGWSWRGFVIGGVIGFVIWVVIEVMR